MSSIDHLHSETKMLLVKGHPNLLSVQSLVHCLDTDCGMDLQDVHHWFNCTAPPTALTPENVWDRPSKTIRELSFLDTENLD